MRSVSSGARNQRQYPPQPISRRVAGEAFDEFGEFVDLASQAVEFHDARAVCLAHLGHVEAARMLVGARLEEVEGTGRHTISIRGIGCAELTEVVPTLVGPRRCCAVALHPFAIALVSQKPDSASNSAYWIWVRSWPPHITSISRSAWSTLEGNCASSTTLRSIMSSLAWGCKRRALPSHTGLATHDAPDTSLAASVIVGCRLRIVPHYVSAVPAFRRATPYAVNSIHITAALAARPLLRRKRRLCGIPIWFKELPGGQQGREHGRLPQCGVRQCRHSRRSAQGPDCALSHRRSP